MGWRQGRRVSYSINLLGLSRWRTIPNILFCFCLALSASMVASTGSITQIVAAQLVHGDFLPFYKDFSSFLSSHLYGALVFFLFFFFCYFSLCLLLIARDNCRHLLRFRVVCIIAFFIISLIFADIIIFSMKGRIHINDILLNIIADFVGGFIGSILILTCLGKEFVLATMDGWPPSSNIAYKIVGIITLCILWVIILFFLFFEIKDEPFDITLSSLQPLILINTDSSMQLEMRTTSPMVFTDNSFPFLNGAATKYSGLHIALSGQDPTSGTPAELGALLSTPSTQLLMRQKIPEDALNAILNNGIDVNDISEDKIITATALDIPAHCLTYFGSRHPMDVSVLFSNMRALVFASGDLTEPQYRLSPLTPHGIKNISFLFAPIPGQISVSISRDTLLYTALQYDYDLYHNDGTKETIQWCNTQVESGTERSDIATILGNMYDLEKLKSDSTSRIFTAFKIHGHENIIAHFSSMSLAFLSKDAPFIMSAVGDTAIDISKNKPEITLSGRTIQNDGNSALIFESAGSITISGSNGYLSIRGNGILLRGTIIYGDTVYMNVKNLINMRHYQYIPTEIAAILIGSILGVIGLCGREFVKTFIKST